MWDDPIVAEVRRVREQLAAQFGFDAKAIFDDLKKRQSGLGNRLVSRPRSITVANAQLPESKAQTVRPLDK
jgi:hypothetical protein